MSFLGNHKYHICFAVALPGYTLFGKLLTHGMSSKKANSEPRSFKIQEKKQLGFTVMLTSLNEDQILDADTKK